MTKDNAPLRGWRNIKISVALVLGGNGVRWIWIDLRKWYNFLYHFLPRSPELARYSRHGRGRCRSCLELGRNDCTVSLMRQRTTDLQMNKPKLNPSYPTVPILIFSIFTGLFGIAIGIYGIFIVQHALVTGRTYYFTVIWGDSAMVSRSSSPVEYWEALGVMIIAIIGGIGLGPISLVSSIVDLIKKLARQKKEKITHRH